MDCCEPRPGRLDVGTTSAEHRFAVRGFVALWNGERPQLTELDAEPTVVEAMHQGGRIVVDHEGRLVGIHGLAAQPTRHHIAHHGRIVPTWCAFDAIGIPAALRLDARAVTTCPTCDRPLQVDFDGGEPAGAAELRLWLPQGQCEHLLDDFCAQANLYCDERHLADARLRSAGIVLTVHDAADLGRRSWADAAAALRS